MLDGQYSGPGGPRVASASRPEILSLRSPDDFRRVLSLGSRRRVGDLTVVWAPSQPAPARREEVEEGQVRVGLVAGKRTGNAVQRNRVKRRLRQAVIRAGLPAGDYVVFAGAAVISMPFSELVSSIRTGAQQAHRGAQ